MQKIAFGLRVRALFWGREKRGASLTPNATLRKSMCIDWEWDAIFSRLQKGVYRWSGFIGCEKKMCFNWEWELFWEMRKSSGLVWEWEQKKEEHANHARVRAIVEAKFWKNLQQQRIHLRAYTARWGQTQISKRSGRSTSMRRGVSMSSGANNNLC